MNGGERASQTCSSKGSENVFRASGGCIQVERLARLGLECGGGGRGTGRGHWAANGVVSCAVSRNNPSVVVKGGLCCQ